MAKNKHNNFATRKPEPTKMNITHREPAFYESFPMFSFQHYDHGHGDFSVCCINAIDDFHSMFERLQTMSQLKWKKIRSTAHMFHFHPIDWSDTSRPNGIPSLNAKFKEVPPVWQFKNFKECRIIGFFNQDNIFEIV